jgi:hypothetical protein
MATWWDSWKKSGDLKGSLQGVKTDSPAAASIRPGKLIIQALGDMTMVVDQATVSILGITMAKPAYDLIVGVIGGFVVLLLQRSWPWLQSVFDGDLRRQAKQIEGSWEATENFQGSGETGTFRIEISCVGGRVSGKYICLTGPDAGEPFSLHGTFKDQILTFLWSKEGNRATESGTVTAKLTTAKELEGHGLYFEPGDGKVHPSIFFAKPI